MVVGIFMIVTHRHQSQLTECNPGAINSVSTWRCGNPLVVDTRWTVILRAKTRVITRAGVEIVGSISCAKSSAKFGEKVCRDDVWISRKTNSANVISCTSVHSRYPQQDSGRYRRGNADLAHLSTVLHMRYPQQ